MPAETIADRAETEILAQPVIAQDMLVVARRPNEIETNAVAAPVRRTLEAGLKESGEWGVHGGFNA